MSELPHLSRDILPPDQRYSHPVRVLQFGTGGLLRALVNDVLDRANRNGQFKGQVATIASTKSDRTHFLNQQEGLFTQLVEGVRDGEKINRTNINQVIAKAYTASEDWEEILALVRQEDIRIIVSNTTEMGLVYEPEKSLAHLPNSFPGKLTVVLYQCYLNRREEEIVVLPTELRENNGDILREIVQRHLHEHEMEAAFGEWLTEKVHFCNTLVDRIVPGSPDIDRQAKLEQQLSYQDKLITVAEPFSFWAIEGESRLQTLLPFVDGKQVILSQDISPFRERKLRILNGAHTFLVPVGHLCGLESVAQCMEDPDVSGFIRHLILDEILSALPEQIPKRKLFAAEVLDRFRNPFIHHKLLDIAFQSTTKMGVRNGQNIHQFLTKNDRAPSFMAYGIAAWIHFNRPFRQEGHLFFAGSPEYPYPLKDKMAEWWQHIWSEFSPETINQWVRTILSNQDIWSVDLSSYPAFAKAVAEAFRHIQILGARACLKELLQGKL